MSIISMLLIVSFFVSYSTEISSRLAYCMAHDSVENVLLDIQLTKKKTMLWQKIGEAVVAWFLAWNLVTLVINGLFSLLWNLNS